MMSVRKSSLYIGLVGLFPHLDCFLEIVANGKRTKVILGMDPQDNCKPWFVANEWTPTLHSQMQKLQVGISVYKDRMLVHLGCNKNDGKMPGVALCQHQGLICRAVFSVIRYHCFWPNASSLPSSHVGPSPNFFFQCCEPPLIQNSLINYHRHKK